MTLNDLKLLEASTYVIRETDRIRNGLTRQVETNECISNKGFATSRETAEALLRKQNARVATVFKAAGERPRLDIITIAQARTLGFTDSILDAYAYRALRIALEPPWSWLD